MEDKMNQSPSSDYGQVIEKPQCDKCIVELVDKRARKAENALSKLINDNRWIPVSISLPDEEPPEGKALITFSFTYGLKSNVYYAEDCNRWFDDDPDDNDFAYDVLLWKYIDLPVMRGG
jgi:hypothetical protein